MFEGNERITKLRNEMIRDPELCVERGELYTASYRETEGLPYPVRRARAMEKILSEMSVSIFDGELIVGRATSKRRGAPLMVEVNGEWYLDGLADMSTREWDTFQQISDADAKRMEEFIPYWKDNTLFSRWISQVPKEIADNIGVTNIPISSPSDGQHNAHVSPGVDIIVRRGIKGLKQDVAERRARLHAEARGDKAEKEVWLDAVDITLDALVAYAHRYAKLAKQMAETEKDPSRKAELETISEVCLRVPENPALNFHEAIQSMWFTYILLMLEGWGMGMSFGRVDQYLYPLYEQELKGGTLTRDEAGELISCLLINMNGVCNFFSAESARNGPGFPMISNLTVGGVTPHGKCAVNDLSYLVMEAEEIVGLTSEDIVVRVNKNTPDAFLMKACEAAKNLHGKFKFIGDETVIGQLLSDGKPPEYARDYVVVGCNFPSVARHSLDLSGDVHSLPKMLELALNNGRCRLTGRLIGAETGDPRAFKSYEEIWDAYVTQVEKLAKDIYPYHFLARELYAFYCPQPFQSSITDGCVEKAVDITSGGSEFRTDPIAGGGVVNVGDSLAAIKKAVFEDQSITMTQLIDALDKDFEGEDEVLCILDRCPKFGNDDEYVDSIVSDVILQFSYLADKQKPFVGAKSTATIAYATMNIGLGYTVGALPDGHKATTPLADAGLSPTQGKNVSGATATVNSVAKLDHLRMTNGSVLNMRFHSDAVADTGKLRKFAQLIRTFCETGGFLVQFNIISTKTLRDAQKDPDKYRDLLIRVATWSAYFVELPPELQEDIIARLEFEEV
jgi:formate C-acetyltransferase